MATKYVLQIDPKVSSEDAKKTESQLNSRFAKVAKNYGDEMRKQNEKVTSGFGSSMKMMLGKLKVGWIALAGVVASVLTNPFDEVDAKLNDLLSKFDNISTRAKQFGVDPTKYWLYTQVGSIAGVKDASQLDNALLRIADRLEMARTGEDPTLKNYLDEKDVIDVFYKLAQTWNTMNPTARASSMADILGTRQANTFAELVQSNWGQLADLALQVNGKQYTPKQAKSRIEKLADLEEQQAIGRAQLQTRELMTGADLISRSSIQSQMSVELTKQRNILEKLKNYATYASTEIMQLQIANTTNDIKTGVQEIVNLMRKDFDETPEQTTRRFVKTKEAVKKFAEEQDPGIWGKMSIETIDKFRRPNFNTTLEDLYPTKRK